MNRREALAALIALPEIGRISRAVIKPTDVVVVECDMLLSEVATERIKDSLLKIWPDRKIIVLCSGVKIKFLQQGLS